MKRLILLLIMMAVAGVVVAASADGVTAEPLRCWESEQAGYTAALMTHDTRWLRINVGVWTVLLPPLGGLLSVAFTSMTGPNDPDWIPSKSDVDQSCYVLAYRRQAHRLDVQATWRAVGGGCLVLLSLGAVVVVLIL